MNDRSRRWYRGLPWYARFGLGTLFASGLGAAGWLIGYRFWHNAHAEEAAAMTSASLVTLVYGAADAKMRPFVVDSVMAFLLGVPLIYVLVLLTEIPVTALGLVPFSAHAYFVRPVLGALVGTGLCVLLNLKGMSSKVLDRMNSTPGEDPWAGMRQWFFDGLSFRTGIAFMVAALFVIPRPTMDALITVGAAWGIVAAAVQLVFTVHADRQPVREAWLRILLIEFLLAFGLILTLAQAISNHSLARQALELVPPAVLTCAATYGAVCLIATATAHDPGRAENHTLSSNSGGGSGGRSAHVPDHHLSGLS
jgi:hypothetical protein